MLDLIVSGGVAVMPEGTAAVDIGIAGEKIVAITAPGALGAPGDSHRVIDATGQIVIPGGVDPHIHCLSPIPFPGRNEEMLSAPPDQVSRAALYGGTTTMLDFVDCPPEVGLQQSIEARRRQWAGACYCDYGLHLLVRGKPPIEHLAALPEAIEAGYASVKMFTTDIRPNRQGRMVQFGDIWEVLKVVAKEGGIAAIHAEDNDIVMHMYEKLIREDRVGFENMAEVHNTLSEDLSFNRVIRLAENIEGAALYMVHVSAATGVAAIAQSRARGFPIYGETLHQYLLYTAEDYKRPGGQMFHTYPSLKFAKDQAALWAGTNHGAIQTIATDEVCCPLKVKLQGNRIDDTTGGNSGVEPRIALMYTHMVSKRGYSLADFVGLISSNAAKIMGLYPRKGALAIGSDADIVLLDPRAGRVIRKEDLHETDYTPWEGHEVSAWPGMTILRGKVAVQGGQLLATPADGQFLPRKIGDDIRARPAV
ncbi:MAG: amidohydrolase family protein [Alphaproteobacteria bacterium]|nr:amidohydrolase family protein [Alphaproteobacteria bacterium]